MANCNVRDFVWPIAMLVAKLTQFPYTTDYLQYYYYGKLNFLYISRWGSVPFAGAIELTKYIFAYMYICIYVYIIYTYIYIYINPRHRKIVEWHGGSGSCQQNQTLVAD